MSDDALSILIPILEDIFGWTAPRIRSLLEQHGLILQEWETVQTDAVTITNASAGSNKRGLKQLQVFGPGVPT